MASFSSNSLPRIGRLGATLVARRYVQGGSNLPKDAGNIAKRGLNEAKRIGENLTGHPAEDAKEKAEQLAEKAKEAAQEAWESAKDSVHHTQETVQSKADVAMETVKETAERSMNTKNNPPV